MRALEVWMNGHHVGRWLRRQGQPDRFEYAASWYREGKGRSLSLSVPLTPDATVRGPEVTRYFDNLLPDNPRIRERLSRQFGTDSAEAFDLLEAIGRDCVGAVQLLPEGREPVGWDRIESQRLTPREVEALLEAVPSPVPMLGRREEHSDFRLSIAGNQEKTALLRIGRQWHRPQGATPTTHILKLPLGVVGGGLDLTDSVDNEWLCTTLLRQFALPVADTDIGRFGEQRVLIVRRFDRRWQGIGEADPYSLRFKVPPTAWIARLPQEDMCQAHAVDQARKYEVDGGPGMAQILDTLSAGRDPEEDQRTFLLTQFAFWLLAATDGHAKNFSIHHTPGGAYQLTPIYDVLSAWPVTHHGTKRLQYKKDVRMAMAVRANNAHYRVAEIHARHWQALSAAWPQAGAWAAMCELAASVDEAIATVERMLPDDFSEAVWTAVTAGLERHREVFLHGAKRL